MFEFLCSMLFLEPITRLHAYLSFSNYFSEMHSVVIRIFKGRTERTEEGKHIPAVWYVSFEYGNYEGPEHCSLGCVRERICFFTLGAKFCVLLWTRAAKFRNYYRVLFPSKQTFLITCYSRGQETPHFCRIRISINIAIILVYNLILS
jgi:hypothetical protein